LQSAGPGNPGAAPDRAVARCSPWNYLPIGRLPRHRRNRPLPQTRFLRLGLVEDPRRSSGRGPGSEKPCHEVIAARAQSLLEMSGRPRAGFVIPIIALPKARPDLPRSRRQETFLQGTARIPDTGVTDRQWFAHYRPWGGQCVGCSSKPLQICGPALPSRQNDKPEVIMKFALLGPMNQISARRCAGAGKGAPRFN